MGAEQTPGVDDGTLIFQCTHGIDDAERANLPFIRANTAAAAGLRAAVYLSGDAVRLATTAGGRRVRYGGHPSVEEMLHVLLRNGGRVWVCTYSASLRGLSTRDLVAGSKFVDPVAAVQAAMAATSVVRG